MAISKTIELASGASISYTNIRSVGVNKDGSGVVIISNYLS